MILELKGIYKDYIQGKMTVPVLKDVNFSMEEGEYVAIVPSSICPGHAAIIGTRMPPSYKSRLMPR